MTLQTTQARVATEAIEAVKRLRNAMPSQGLPSETTQTDILSALAMYTTPEQAAGMLSAYWRHTAMHGAPRPEQPSG